MAILVMLCLRSLKAWPIHFHFLCFVVVATSSCPVLARSSSFMMTSSQKMPSVWRNLCCNCYSCILINIGLQALDVQKMGEMWWWGGEL